MTNNQWLNCFDYQVLQSTAIARTPVVRANAQTARYAFQNYAGTACDRSSDSALSAIAPSDFDVNLEGCQKNPKPGRDISTLVWLRHD